MAGAEEQKGFGTTEAEDDRDEATPDTQKEFRELHAAEVAGLAGPTITAKHVLDVRRAEMIGFMYGNKEHMGG